MQEGGGGALHRLLGHQRCAGMKTLCIRAEPFIGVWRPCKNHAEEIQEQEIGRFAMKGSRRVSRA